MCCSCAEGRPAGTEEAWRLLRSCLARSPAAARPPGSCSADVEAGLRKHLATAQRIVRIATLCRKHELPGEAAEGNTAEEPCSAQLPAPAAGAAQQQEAAEGVGKAEQEAAQGDGEEEQEACSHLPAGFEGSRPGSSSSSQHGRKPSSSSGSSSSPSIAGAADALAELGLQPGSDGQRLVGAFVRRMNRAVLCSAALEQERLRLAAENSALRAVIKEVEDCGRVGPGAAEGPLNTLLIVNERLQRELGGAAAQRSTSVQAAGR